MYQSKKQKTMTYLVLGIYLVLLIWLVLFKLTVNFGELARFRSFNYIPFYYDSAVSFHAKEVIYNILIFIPLGVYIAVLKKEWPFALKIVPCLFLSIAFEIAQFVFAIGASDITDVITNTLGGIIGIVLGFCLRKIFRQKHMAIINISGGLIEGVAVTLLAILLIANR